MASQEEMTVIEADVTAGPSDMQLMFSLMRPNNGALKDIKTRESTAVIFTVDWSDRSDDRILACIESMTREDDSGQSWILAGYAIDGAFGKFVKFEGYYNSRTRKGRLKRVS